MEGVGVEEARRGRLHGVDADTLARHNLLRVVGGATCVGLDQDVDAAGGIGGSVGENGGRGQENERR